MNHPRSLLHPGNTMAESQAILLTIYILLNKPCIDLNRSSNVYTFSDEPEKERRKRSRSRSLTPGAEAYQALSLSNEPAGNEAQDEDVEAEIAKLTRKKSKNLVLIN